MFSIVLALYMLFVFKFRFSLMTTKWIHAYFHSSCAKRNSRPKTKRIKNYRTKKTWNLIRNRYFHRNIETCDQCWWWFNGCIHSTILFSLHRSDCFLKLWYCYFYNWSKKKGNNAYCVPCFGDAFHDFCQKKSQPMQPDSFG